MLHLNPNDIKIIKELQSRIQDVFDKILCSFNIVRLCSLLRLIKVFSFIMKKDSYRRLDSYVTY